MERKHIEGRKGGEGRRLGEASDDVWVGRGQASCDVEDERERERVRKRLSERVIMIDCVRCGVFDPGIPRLAFIYKH